ncbi:DNA recombination protein RmuC [Spirochaetia bacterium]|nr:DNA recombination protein RmuC [Spirochaetia bacterium]
MEVFAAIIVLVILLIQTILLIIFLARRPDASQDEVLGKFLEYEKRLDKSELSLRDEFGRNREDINRSSKDSREELNKVFINFTGLLETRLKGILESVDNSSRQNRAELTRSLEKVRETVEKRLQEIQADNSLKLEKMRETVDEKLHKTLETRLGESFKLVSDRLELVQKGLGEMQSLAVGVGDLKKVLSNVKTKGVLGESQLGAILEQILTVEMYEKNVNTKKTGRDIVEYAVKIPGKDDSAKFIWLPIDAKFPSESYERLIAAYDTGTADEVEKYRKELERTIKSFAKDIRDKYVESPKTTDFAIMFLPFESLFAEVLRIPGLFESVQREMKITITGPTTISAFLSSLQMGFRTLAVEKRTSEIWDLLGAVRTEFGKFGEVLKRTKDKLDSASREIESAETRSRVIEKKLRNVQTLPGTPEQKLLEDTGLVPGSDEDE